MEIYNEQIVDLLDTTTGGLQLREDLKKGVYVENLSEEVVSSPEDIEKLLELGYRYLCYIPFSFEFFVIITMTFRLDACPCSYNYLMLVMRCMFSSFSGFLARLGFKHVV
jgi:hypothetical protein